MRRLLYQGIIFFAALTACNAQSENDIKKEFAKYNINGDTWLDGKELTACNCLAFDTNNDKEVSLEEFIAGKKGKTNVEKQPAGKNESKPIANKVHTFKKGDKVEVQEAGIWYPSEILEMKGDQYKIHFTGWGSNWDT